MDSLLGRSAALSILAAMSASCCMIRSFADRTSFCVVPSCVRKSATSLATDFTSALVLADAWWSGRKPEAAGFDCWKLDRAAVTRFGSEAGRPVVTVVSCCCRSVSEIAGMVDAEDRNDSADIEEFGS